MAVCPYLEYIGLPGWHVMRLSLTFCDGAPNTAVRADSSATGAIATAVGSSTAVTVWAPAKRVSEDNIKRIKSLIKK